MNSHKTERRKPPKFIFPSIFEGSSEKTPCFGFSTSTIRTCVSRKTEASQLSIQSHLLNIQEGVCFKLIHERTILNLIMEKMHFTVVTTVLFCMHLFVSLHKDALRMHSVPRSTFCNLNFLSYYGGRFSEDLIEGRSDTLRYQSEYRTNRKKCRFSSNFL